MSHRYEVAIVGAGPYGLATAAHLRSKGVTTGIFGEVMGAWRRMPRGMLLRSFREATTIADPSDSLTIDAFQVARRRVVPTPVPLRDFIDYGEWFQRQMVLDVDARLVASVAARNAGFRLILEDGELVYARRVVVAAGIGHFAWIPPAFRHVDPALASHSSAHPDFKPLSDRRVLVVGSGQSALESAALLHEAGAEVSVVARADRVFFLRGDRLHEVSGAVRAIFYPTWGVGPPGVNLLMGAPQVFTRIPSRLREPLAQRAIRPAGAAWLKPRLASVPIVLGTQIERVESHANGLRIHLDNGAEEVVDHALLATGYRVDICRYPFLEPALVKAIGTANGFPRLMTGYESSVPGLHFIGASAAKSFGPGMRFVSHTRQAARSITRAVVR